MRDLPALLGVFACFWLFVIPLITEGFRVMRGGKPDQRKFDALADPLLAAEATLAFALWREAYRRLGYNPRLVKLELADLPPNTPSGFDAMIARMRSYMDQVQNLSRAAAHYTEVLRRRWSAAPAAHASTGALGAAHHEAAGISTTQICTSLGALILRRPKAVSKDEGVLANARGPPQSPRLPIADRLLPQRAARLGSYCHAC